VRTLVIAGLLLAGCENHTKEVPLADLEAKFYLYPGTGTRTVALGTPLGPEGELCPVLPDGTTATFNGEKGEVDVGGWEQPHGEVHCISPSATWPARAPSPGMSTIVFDDGDTTWTFEIADAFADREIELVSPAGGTLKSGDAVTLRLSPPSGTLARARVFATSSQVEYFQVDETSGLVVTGTELRFTVPTVRAASTMLTLGADLELAVTRCDAPLGCVTKGVISSSRPITLVP